MSNLTPTDRLSDAEFTRRFADGSLDPAAFDHEAHLRLAWLHIREQGIERAERIIKQQLLDYVKHVGAQEKYHETLTVAAIRAVYHFMLKSCSDRFPAFIAEFPALKTDFKTLISSHYSFDVFSSSAAKLNFIAPDLAPFPG